MKEVLIMKNIAYITLALGILYVTNKQINLAGPEINKIEGHNFTLKQTPSKRETDTEFKIWTPEGDTTTYHVITENKKDKPIKEISKETKKGKTYFKDDNLDNLIELDEDKYLKTIKSNNKLYVTGFQDETLISKINDVDFSQIEDIKLDMKAINEEYAKIKGEYTTNMKLINNPDNAKIELK